jgi:L-tyrosine C(3)-methyltransferase
MKPLPESAASLLPALFGHAAFQHLNAACRLGLLDHLHEHPNAGRAELRDDLRLSDRAIDTLLLGATATGLLTESPADRFRVSAPVESLFDSGAWESFRALVEFESEIVYLSHSGYVDSLRDDTNAGLAWFPGAGDNLYQRLSADSRLNELFFRAMHAWSALTDHVLIHSDALAGVGHLLDLGGGDGVNAIAIARRWPHLRITLFDMADAVEIAEDNVARAELSDRISCVPGDMFSTAYPGDIDAVLLANQLSIWSEKQNRELMARAHDALPAGGRLMVFNQFVFGDGATRLYAALDAVYFATLPTASSRLWTVETCTEWMIDAGFEPPVWTPATWTPHGTIVATR